MRGVLDDLTEGKVREYEARWRRKDVTTVYFAGTSAPCFSEAGEFLSSIYALREITERKKTEESLQKYTKRLETLHEIDEGILNARSLEEIAGAVLHRVTELVPCRGAIITLLDYEAHQEVVFASQFSGESRLVSKFPIAFADSWKLNERLDDLRQGHVIIVDDVRTLPHSPVIRTIIADGVHSFVRAPLLVCGELIGEFCLGTDLVGGFGPEDQDIIREVANSLAIAIAQVRLFEEVVVSRDRLRLLKQQLVEAQEIERRRLAQELHDRIGQNLTALSINLNIMSNQLPADLAANLGPRLTDSMTLVETTAEIIRDITGELSSPVLDEYGLEAGFREYVQRYQQRTGIAVELQPDGVAGRLRPDEQLALYRIAQEALTNIAKHAQASQVTIALETTDQVRRMVIADNGVGFNPDALRTPAEGRGLGLLSIRDRAESIGGSLRVESSPGHGTRVIVELKR